MKLALCLLTLCLSSCALTPEQRLQLWAIGIDLTEKTINPPVTATK